MKEAETLALSTLKAVMEEKVGPGGLCSPHHHPPIRPSFLELNCSL